MCVCVGVITFEKVKVYICKVQHFYSFTVLYIIFFQFFFIFTSNINEMKFRSIYIQEVHTNTKHILTNIYIYDQTNKSLCTKAKTKT